MAQRTPFLIKTPDLRFPAGETRAAQQAASPTKPAYDKFPYIRNRSTQDVPGDPFGNSFYDFYRYKYLRDDNGVGPFPLMTRAENDMLAAEGHLRKNNFAAAAVLIDRYRVKAGLPSVAGITSLTTPVPGGSACVPRVPTGATTACGNIWEAMKWEKRMETAFNGYASWFVDSRGWGDLVEATPLEWPVPYQEMDARGLSFYNSQTGAARGTYGF
jgi:hypothetical protein